MEILLVLLYNFLRIYYFLLIGSILLTWIPEITQTQFYKYLRRLTDPYLRIFRGLLVIGMIDLTPILGLLIYQFALNSLAQIIIGL